jgi:hypothetical protein
VKKRKRRPQDILPGNWPPSRGPMPARVKPTYEIPEPVIEPIMWISTFPHKPATEIKRVPTKPPPAISKKNKALRRRGIYAIRDLMSSANARREVYLHLNAHVVTTATLKPVQWCLIGGAELCPPNKHRRKSIATISTNLPVRTITVDLDYPFDKTARVTIQPYTVIWGRGRKYEEMSIGYVLWQLARAYKIIYRRHRQYGIWGHAISDLCFEAFELKDNVGSIHIGS